MSRQDPEARRAYQQAYYQRTRAWQNHLRKLKRWRRHGRPRRWTLTQRRRLARRYDAGASLGVLAGEEGVSRTHISQLIKGCRDKRDKQEIV